MQQAWSMKLKDRLVRTDFPVGRNNSGWNQNSKVVPHLLLQVGEENFQMLVADTIEVDINLDSTAIMITSVRTVENLVTVLTCRKLTADREQSAMHKKDNGEKGAAANGDNK